MMIECVCRRVSADVSTTWPAAREQDEPVAGAADRVRRTSTVTPPAVSSEIAPVEPCRQFGRDQTRYQVHPVAAQVRRRQPQAGIAVHFGRYSPACGIAGGTIVFSPTPPSRPFSRGVACGSVLPERDRGEHVARARLVGDAGDRVVPRRQRVRAGVQQAREGARTPTIRPEPVDRVGVRPGEAAPPDRDRGRDLRARAGRRTPPTSGRPAWRKPARSGRDHDVALAGCEADHQHEPRSGSWLMTGSGRDRGEGRGQARRCNDAGTGVLGDFVARTWSFPGMAGAVVSVPRRLWPPLLNCDATLHANVGTRCC